LLPIEFPEYFPSGTPQSHLQRIINLSKCADVIVPVSQDVGKKLSELLQALSIKTPEIVPIESGVEEAFLENGKLFEERDEPLNQFVIVSTIEPRKNHLMLLEIWRDFLHAGLLNIPKLHIVGRRGWNNDNVFSFLDNAISLKAYVIEHTDIPDEKVMAILNESKAALFPSFGEGWGLPPVESLAAGVPTICSDIPVLREATKEHAIYINPNDHFGWRNMILELSQMSATDFRMQNSTFKSFMPIVWGESFEKLRSVING
jgi:glycosyltransferase involved in cell wall biosynthesis